MSSAVRLVYDVINLLHNVPSHHCHPCLMHIYFCLVLLVCFNITLSKFRPFGDGSLLQHANIPQNENSLVAPDSQVGKNFKVILKGTVATFIQVFVLCLLSLRHTSHVHRFILLISSFPPCMIMTSLNDAYIITMPFQRDLAKISQMLEND